MSRCGPYVAAVVDEASKVSTLGGVNDGVVVHAEHVAAADALILITLLPHVRDHLRTKPDRHQNTQLDCGPRKKKKRHHIFAQKEQLSKIPNLIVRVYLDI